MKKISVLLGVIFLFCWNARVLVAQGIRFQERTYEDILKQAKAENKPVFIDFYATWCEPCKQLAENVFTDERLATYFNSHFLCLRVDIDKLPKLAQKYQIQSIPTMVFLDAKGKETRRQNGVMHIQNLLHLGQEVCGDRPTYLELYKQFQDNPGDLDLLQNLLLEAPAYANELTPTERLKWRKRADKLFATYLEKKGLARMINTDDFQLLLMYVERVNPGDSILNFVNTHRTDFEKVTEPRMVWEFIISRQSGLINQLAIDGNLEYQKELERINGDMKDVYVHIQREGLSVYNVMKNQADADYALYAHKDEKKYMELKEAYFQMMGNLLSYSDYQGAIDKLVAVRKNALQPASYERCLVWLDRAIQLQVTPKEQMQAICYMGNCYKALDNVDKAKACYNQAYVLAMQLNDTWMQAQIKAVLQMISD